MNEDPSGQDGVLERFTSPEPTFVEQPSEKHQNYSADQTSEKHPHFGGDQTSSSELPLHNHNDTVASSRVDGETKGKKRRSFLPKFLGGKKKDDDDTVVADDDNNGKKKKEYHFTAWGQFRATVLGSWVNVLLIFCESPYFSCNAIKTNKMQLPLELRFISLR